LDWGVRADWIGMDWDGMGGIGMYGVDWDGMGGTGMDEKLSYVC